MGASFAMATANTVDTDFGASAAKPDSKKPGDRIQCVVVTPERTLFDELVEFVVLPLIDGEMGILHNRSPVIGRLGFGELRTKSHGTTRRYFVDGGFAQVRDNVVTVLTNRAIPAGMLDAQASAKELELAQARQPTGAHDRAEKTKAVDRAKAMIRVASHAGKD
jgi:F-type H+-transporting ATPase subunit epsilon